MAISRDAPRSFKHQPLGHRDDLQYSTELFHPESGSISGVCCILAYSFARSSITLCDSGGVSIESG